MTNHLKPRLRGHLITVAPHVAHMVRPRRPPQTRQVGAALLRDEPGSRRLLVVVHGLGGSVDAGYMVRAANHAHQLGVSCARIALGQGRGLYHAGYTEDIARLLESPEASAYDEVSLLGFSLGGHIALRATIDGIDPRLVATASVCAPIRLKHAVAHIDRRASVVYRTNVLVALKALYARLPRDQRPARRRRVARITTLREYDDIVTAPQFGFASADAYYDAVDVTDDLGRATIPVRIISTRDDPMIPAFAAAPTDRAVHDVVDGGHAYLQLRSTPPGELRRIVEWLATPTASMS